MISKIKRILLTFFVSLIIGLPLLSFILLILFKIEFSISFLLIFINYVIFYKIILKTDNDIISRKFKNFTYFLLTNLYYHKEEIIENNKKYTVKRDLLDNQVFFLNNKKHREKDAAFIPYKLSDSLEFWYEGNKIHCNDEIAFKEAINKIKLSNKISEF